jgi:hypothetical protein
MQGMKQLLGEPWLLGGMQGMQQLLEGLFPWLQQMYQPQQW